MKIDAPYIKYLEWILMLAALYAILFISKELGIAKELKPDTTTEKYIMMIGIFVMAFIVLGVHELGHLITGLLSGFRFDLYVVGPLGIKRENDRVKFYLNKNLAYYGGVAATSPVNDDEENGNKFAKILLAGPIASILFAVFCFLISSFIGKPFGIIFYTGGLISIGIFFATTIPSRTGMFFTDRKRYQRLVNPGKDRQVELAMLNIIGKFAKDNSYKNMNEDDMNLLLTDDYPFIRFFGLFNHICYQIETKGFTEEETMTAYTEQSAQMSKSIVKAFNDEIEKFKNSLSISSEVNKH